MYIGNKYIYILICIVPLLFGSAHCNVYRHFNSAQLGHRILRIRLQQLPPRMLKLKENERRILQFPMGRIDN